MPVDGVSTIPLCKDVYLLRGSCSERLKYEVEYSLKKGSTDNCYVIKAPNSTLLIDVPNEAYSSHFSESRTCTFMSQPVSHMPVPSWASHTLELQ